MLNEWKQQQDGEGIKVSLKELIALQSCVADLIIPLSKSVKSHVTGGYISSRRGRGMEFEEVRVYSPGDDVRAMDWRVTARTNQPHVKIYREERERPVFLVVDFSSTMFFGTRVAFKSVIAAKVAASLAWISAKAGDRVGAMLFSENDELDFKPRSRDAGVLPILNGLSQMSMKNSEIQCAGKMSSVLGRLSRVAPSGSLIFILSDFEKFDSSIEKQLQLLAGRHQLVGGLIYDPMESELPQIGLCQLTNGKENLLLNTSSKDTQHQYKMQFFDKTNKVSECFKGCGQRYFQLGTNQPIMPVLCDVLRSQGVCR